MVWRRSKRDSAGALERSEALACIPMKRPEVDETRGAHGLVCLAYPMPVSPWVLRVARMLGRPAGTHQLKKTELDCLGSAVWGLMDGRRSVGQIIKAFAKEHQLLQREAELAVTQFIRELGRRGVIALK
ncbi:MAG: PqqD family protein [Desulfobacterales bacterium]